MLRRFYSVKIHPKLTSTEQIHKLLSTATWSPTQLLSSHNDSARSSTIDESTVQRLLQLSGLEADADEYPRMISVLKEQVRFIDHLHSVAVEEQEEIHHVGQRLTLNDIKQQIQQQSQDSAKGEVSGSWNPMSLASHSKHGQYIVREGLLKDK